MNNLTFSLASIDSNTSNSLSKELCFFLPDPKFDKVTRRYVTNLLTGVLNAVLLPCAIVANSLVILVIIRKVSLRSPLNLLLGCLAVSDLLVGLFVQPSYVAFRLVENQDTFVPSVPCVPCVPCVFIAIVLLHRFLCLLWCVACHFMRHKLREIQRLVLSFTVLSRYSLFESS